MTISTKDGNTGINAVRRLRISKLRNGHPFLIYSKDLPTRQAYLEFPEGKILLVTVKVGEQEFTTLRELSKDENSAIRTELNLELVQ